MLSIPAALCLQLSSSAPVQTADLALYRPALQRVAITKMLQQLSQVLPHRCSHRCRGAPTPQRSCLWHDARMAATIMVLQGCNPADTEQSPPAGIG